MSNWYAIRTSAGAQQPQREYEVEDTVRGKGYRIVPSLNANVSAVERALSRAGYQYYMPTEYKVVRSRKKTGVHNIRRFAMLPGYIFFVGCRTIDGKTEDEINGEALRKIPGVAGVVSCLKGDHYSPMEIPISEIITLRTVEAKSHLAAEREVSAKNSSERAEISNTAAKALKAAKRKLSVGQRVKVLWGKSAGLNATLMGWDENQQLKALVETLDAGVVEEISLPYDAVRTMLEAAE